MLTFGSNCTPVQRKLFCARHTNMYTRSVLCCAHNFFISNLRFYICLLWPCVDKHTARMVWEFSFVSAFGGWTGVDQLPEELQSWFEVDLWYLDSLLKTWSESSTADPLLLEVLHIALQQFMLVTNFGFIFRTKTVYTMEF